MHPAQVRDFVFAHKPELGRLYAAYKDQTWIQYARENFPKTVSFVEPVYRQRFAELAEACRTIVEPLFGSVYADQVIDVLKTHRFVGSADHHGVLCHPFFLNSTLLRSIIQPGEPIVTLTCGGISFSNSSYPRGIFFHDSDLVQKKIPFVPWRDRQFPIYGHKPLGDIDLERTYRRFDSINIPQDKKLKVFDLFQAFSDDVGYKRSRTISEQFSVMSQILWRKSGMKTDLVYIEVEKLACQLLLQVHIWQDTLIHRIMFDVVHRDLYLKYFDRVTGAHTGSTQGTQLFWYIDHLQSKRVALTIKGTCSNQYVLQSEDKSTTIVLNPEEISKRISDCSLFPCLALCYSMISFYYGITLGGGFSQIDYLSRMKIAYQNMVKSSTCESDQTCKKIATHIFAGEFVMAGVGKNMQTLPATLMDMLFWGNDSTSRDIEKVFSSRCIGESLDTMMHQFAHIISPTGIQEPESPTFPACIYVN